MPQLNTPSPANRACGCRPGVAQAIDLITVLFYVANLPAGYASKFLRASAENVTR